MAAKSCKYVYLSCFIQVKGAMPNFCFQDPYKAVYSSYKQYRKTIRKNAKWRKSNIVNSLLSRVHEPPETLHSQEQDVV